MSVVQVPVPCLSRTLMSDMETKKKKWLMFQGALPLQNKQQSLPRSVVISLRDGPLYLPLYHSLERTFVCVRTAYNCTTITGEGYMTHGKQRIVTNHLKLLFSRASRSRPRKRLPVL